LGVTAVGDSYETNFYIVLAGNIIANLSIAIFINGLGGLVVTWFGETERSYAISLGSLMFPLSNIISSYLAATYSKGIDEDDINQVIEMEKSMVKTQNWIITAVAVPLFFIVKEKPDQPPSELALIKREVD
jgi:nucleoside permease NupC